MADFRDILDHGSSADASSLLHKEGANVPTLNAGYRGVTGLSGAHDVMRSDGVTLGGSTDALGKRKTERAMKGLTRAQKRRVMRKVARKAQALGRAGADIADAADGNATEEAIATERTKSAAYKLGAVSRSAAKRAWGKAMEKRRAKGSDATSEAVTGKPGEKVQGETHEKGSPAHKQTDSPKAAPASQKSTDRLRARSDAKLIKAQARSQRRIGAAAATEASTRSMATTESQATTLASRIKRVVEDAGKGAAGAAATSGIGFLLAAVVVALLIIVLLLTVVAEDTMNDGWGLEGLNDNERIVALYLKEKGLDKVHAAAVMGNISQECGFDAEAIENGTAGGVGIFQWPTTTDNAHGNRMKAYVESTGRAWSNIYGQLDFAWYEISGDESGLPGKPSDYAGVQWMWNYESGCSAFLAANSISRSPGASYTGWCAQTDIDVVTEYFCWGFLRPATWAANTEHRCAEARRYLGILNSGSESDIAGITTDPARKTILQAAELQLGVPYVWGGTTPGVGLDCSGLTQYCYSQAGISIPRNSEDQHAAGQSVPLNQALPGDILWKPGHVAIYIGDDRYIHAPYTGAVVRIESGISYFTCAVRF